jgi:hypothetical protein
MYCPICDKGYKYGIDQVNELEIHMELDHNKEEIIKEFAQWIYHEA